MLVDCNDKDTCNYRVFFNDQELDTCVRADDEAGWVDVVLVARHPRPGIIEIIVDDKGQPIEHRINGRIRIEARQ